MHNHDLDHCSWWQSCYLVLLVLPFLNLKMTINPTEICVSAATLEPCGQNFTCVFRGMSDIQVSAWWYIPCVKYQPAKEIDIHHYYLIIVCFNSFLCTVCISLFSQLNVLNCWYNSVICQQAKWLGGEINAIDLLLLILLLFVRVVLKCNWLCWC